MNKIIAVLLLLILNFFAEHAFAKYEMTLSQNRKDGITVDVQPRYPYLADLYVTMSPDLCLNKGVPAPLPDKNAYILVQRFNFNMDGRQDPTNFFHNEAPAGVNLCYILVGRGQVEVSGWGYRKADWEDNNLKPSDNGLSASKNRQDAVELMMNPPLTDFTDLYLTPAEDNSCPEVGKAFNFSGRYMKAMNEPFNGKYYLHKSAPLGIDLCYFLISKRTNLCVAKAIGYREP